MRNFAPRAQTDLDEAVSWLLDQGFAAAAAEKLLAAVLEAAAMLAKRPGMGRHRLDLLPRPFRFWSIPRHNLILVYDPDPEAAIILRVLSTNQELGPLLEDMRVQFRTPPDDAEKD